MRSNEGLGTPGEGGWPIWLPFPPPENVQRILDHRSRPPRPKNGISVTQTCRLLYIYFTRPQDHKLIYNIIFNL